MSTVHKRVEEYAGLVKRVPLEFKIIQITSVWLQKPSNKYLFTFKEVVAQGQTFQYILDSVTDGKWNGNPDVEKIQTILSQYGTALYFK